MPGGQGRALSLETGSDPLLLASPGLTALFLTGVVGWSWSSGSARRASSCTPCRPPPCPVPGPRDPCLPSPQTPASGSASPRPCRPPASRPWHSPARPAPRPKLRPLVASDSDRNCVLRRRGGRGEGAGLAVAWAGHRQSPQPRAVNRARYGVAPPPPTLRRRSRWVPRGLPGRAQDGRARRFCFGPRPPASFIAPRLSGPASPRAGPRPVRGCRGSPAWRGERPPWPLWKS